MLPEQPNREINSSNQSDRDGTPPGEHQHFYLEQYS